MIRKAELIAFKTGIYKNLFVVSCGCCSYADCFTFSPIHLIHNFNLLYISDIGLLIIVYFQKVCFEPQKLSDGNKNNHHS